MPTSQPVLAPQTPAAIFVVVTGGLFFSPTVDFLDDPPALPISTAPTPAALKTSADGSLAIGSLKGTPQ